MANRIYITETPRDAMQGWGKIIPVDLKVAYINQLLKAGFLSVDVGSFVSPKAIPQMADTLEVISRLETTGSSSELMVITGNKRGGLQASLVDPIRFVAFPYSVSPTFLQKNLNATPEQAWDTIRDLNSICHNSGKLLQVYLAMAFGNPYKDRWNEDIVVKDAESLVSMGVRHLAFSDITGQASAEVIYSLCSRLLMALPGVRLSIHLHSSPGNWEPKVEAAWQAGFRYFEAALGGFGGCPMSGYELVGNLNTANLVKWCTKKNIIHGLNETVLGEALTFTSRVFS
ncbi:MAG: hydroxymethylglutaryl-CoA lyase [Bacteroidetes bacterium]|nr:hydroxymethylglutaryl-CoA lyase [Bacteroidota bacterium]